MLFLENPGEVEDLLARPFVAYEPSFLGEPQTYLEEVAVLGRQIDVETECLVGRVADDDGLVGFGDEVHDRPCVLHRVPTCFAGTDGEERRAADEVRAEVEVNVAVFAGDQVELVLSCSEAYHAVTTFLVGESSNSGATHFFAAEGLGERIVVGELVALVFDRDVLSRSWGRDRDGFAVVHGQAAERDKERDDQHEMITFHCGTLSGSNCAQLYHIIYILSI